MGLPVVLLNSTPDVQCSDGPAGLIADPKGLEAAMAVARVLIPAKLSGYEIRFLRRAIGLKGIDLAKFLDVRPEHLSRWENGAFPISTNAERVLRLRVLNDLKSKVAGVPEPKLDKIMNMHFAPVRSELGPVTLIFERLIAISTDENSRPRPAWIFQGVATEEAEDLRAATG